MRSKIRHAITAIQLVIAPLLLVLTIALNRWWAMLPLVAYLMWLLKRYLPASKPAQRASR